MNVSCIQMVQVEDDTDGAIDRAIRLIRQCRGADVIILPELWNIGFMSFDRYIDGAETENGRTLAAMREMARETGAYLHTGSFVRRQGDHCYNAAFLLSPEGEILGAYHKIHLFSFRSREHELLTPGDHLTVIPTPLATFGLATCFDLRFPELFRRMVDLGAEVFLVCSAWPKSRLEYFRLFNRARASENQCALVSANAAGENRGVAVAGHSMVVDPWGEVVSSCEDGEAIVNARIDIAGIHEARRRFPLLSSRQDWL